MSQTTMTTARIEAQIKALEATPPALVGSDEGTHGKPVNFCVYMTVEGDRYATRQFGGANSSQCSEAEAERDTEGHIRMFVAETIRIQGLAKRLRGLRKQLRDASK